MQPVPIPQLSIIVSPHDPEGAIPLQEHTVVHACRHRRHVGVDDSVTAVAIRSVAIA